MLYNTLKLLFCFFVFVPILSCGTKKKNVSHNQTDRLFGSKHISVKTASIPASRADLAIPLSSLQQLPSGASFVKKERQATAQVRYVSDTLFITATCDSLQQLLCSYEQTIDRLSRSQHQQHSERRSVPHLFYLSVIAGVMLCAVALSRKLKSERMKE